MSQKYYDGFQKSFGRINVDGTRKSASNEIKYNKDEQLGKGERKPRLPKRADTDELKLTSDERLQKVLSHAGVDSRRQCEKMILDGRVRINGRIVSTLGVRVDPRKDDILVDGKKISLRSKQETMWIAVHKPKGVITSTADERGRRTVIDIIPGADQLRLLPVGRLDRDSAGLLLLTNDNSWVNILTHPSYGHEKMYRVTVYGYPDPIAWKGITDGMLLDGETSLTKPCQVDIISYDNRQQLLLVDVILREGKNRQLRRMFDAIGHPVKNITRIRHGPIRIKQLRPGEWRTLTSIEIERLKKSGNVQKEKNSEVKKINSARGKNYLREDELQDDMINDSKFINAVPK